MKRKKFVPSTLYITLLKFSEIVFWNSFDETVRHFCWFSNFSWDKNLFQLDKVWLMFQKFQTLLSVPSENANWIKKEGSDIPSKTKKRFIISSYFIHQYHTAATATWISIILFLFQRVYWKILDKRANQISCNLTRSFLLCRQLLKLASMCLTSYFIWSIFLNSRSFTSIQQNFTEEIRDSYTDMDIKITLITNYINT